MQVAFETTCQLGEGVLWSPLEGCLYWVDIDRGQVFRDGDLIRQGPPVGGFTFQDDGSVLLFGDRGRISSWQFGQETVHVEEIPEVADSRFNDVIAAPDGGVFAGTLNGRLYRLDPDGTLRCLFDDHQQPNGMAFLSQTFYMSDTHQATVFRYRFENGTLTERRAAFKTDKQPGFADGMTVDRQGYFWTARWGGRCLVRYAPHGAVDRVVELPVEKSTSVAFGGPNLDELYVSTAGGGEDEPPAGAVLRLSPGVQGVAENLSRVYFRSR